MEKTSKFVVDNTANPRGKTFTIEDIKQWIIDINSWLTKHLKTQGLPGASEAELQNLRTKLKYLPEPLEQLLRNHNGQIQLLESYKSLSAKEILEACEEYKIYGFWNNDYIPIARDLDGAFLIIQVDKEKAVEKGLITWNRDNGVMEEVNENLGLYLENYSTGLLKKKYEFVEGVGMIESS